jgi:hypothetical protein
MCVTSLSAPQTVIVEFNLFYSFFLSLSTPCVRSFVRSRYSCLSLSCTLLSFCQYRTAVRSRSHISLYRFFPFHRTTPINGDSSLIDGATSTIELEQRNVRHKNEEQTDSVDRRVPFRSLFVDNSNGKSSTRFVCSASSRP